MADGLNKLFLFQAILFANVCQIFCNGSPALIWSPTRQLVDLPDVFAGHTLKHEDFETNYINPLTSTGNELYVIFVQNKLGLDDFAHHANIYSLDGTGGAFHHVKTLLDENFSVQLPAVDFPAKTVDRLLEKFKGRVAELGEPYDAKKMDLSNKRILLVNLPNIQAANERKSFTHNDELIAKVLSGLGDREYIALYTAKSHEQPEEAETLKFHSRHLLAKPSNDTYIFLNKTDCLMLYTRAITLETVNSTQEVAGSLILNEIDTHSITCENKTASLTMSFTPAVTEDNKVKTVDIAFSFSTTASHDWFIQSATITYTGKLPGDNYTADTEREVILNRGQTQYNPLSSIWAPLNMSYHCTMPGAFVESGSLNKTASSVTLQVVFDKLQLQPIAVSGTEFGVVYDCVPFFTGVIWTGIISVFILLMILFLGLSMISEIKVMKNFDDPKGKPLLVQTDD